jgi:cytochrome c
MLIRSRQITAVAAILFLVSACGQAQNGDGSAAPAAGTAAAPAAEPASLEERLAAADPEKGKVVFLQCRACHSLEEGGANKVGPNLWGVFGRKAGLTPGFTYSEVMTASEVVWDEAAMDAWLERPSEFMPGNRMVFVGLRKPEDRANVIAYLKRETGAQ